MAQALLNFLFNRKKNSTHEVVPGVLNEATRDLYLAAEFESLGDVLKDRFLRQEEFVRLLSLLGYPGDESEVEKIWNSCVSPETGLMTEQEYIAIMADESLREKTDTWRKLFAQFDIDGNGYATKAEVVQGLENIGVTITPEVKAKLEAMDENKDGKISYSEFLKQQLQQ